MVSAAVKLCDREFQAIPVFSVQKFLSRLTETVGAPPKPGELFAAMNRLRVITDIEAIGPDPVTPTPQLQVKAGYAESVPTRTRGRETPAYDFQIDSWASVFSAILTGILSELRRLGSDMPAEARAGVAMRLQRVDLAPGSYSEMNAWADGVSDGFTDQFTPDDMHKSLHEFYQWVCEELGPVETDRLFGTVIRDVSQYPGAAQFPPRNLF